MILQYLFSTDTATVYKAGSAAANYSGSLLSAVVSGLSALVPAGQTADMFEIDPADDVPSAWTDQQQTDADGNSVTVQVPAAWRKHVTGVIATNIGTIPFDSETCSSDLQTALLALWADIDK